MEKAVIYARYSSGKQREASIEDQLRVCREWCRSNGYDIAREYSDKAISGRTDHRPQFQAMIRNAPESDVIVVYAMDRFSRDQYDAPIYKKALADEGVRVVSATESIDSSPEGVFMEKIMEGWAAYYSLNLSRSVMRGMVGNAMKCKANGVPVFGYRTNADGLYEVDDNEAMVVKESFARYISGEALHSIADDLAKRGVKGPRGNPINPSNLKTMIHNRKYIGEYRWGDVVIPDGMPAIIDKPVFAAAQVSVPRKRRKAEEWDDYKLTGKLWCGLCGKPMRGVSGRSHTGRKYSYYACPTKGCMRNVPKDALEDTLAKGVVAMMRDPARAEKVAKRACECFDTSDIDARIEAAEKALEAALRGIRGIEDAICAGIVTEGLRIRLEGYKSDISRLEPELDELREQRNHEADWETVRDFLMLGMSTDDTELVLGAFIDKVVLFEESMALTMAYTDLEKGEPAEFSLMGGGFSPSSLGSPPYPLVEPELRIFPWGVALFLPRT